MESQGISALHKRLDRLEARNRALAVALLVLLGLCALAFGCAASSPVQEVVRARAFDLVDASGEIRAELGTFPDGTHGLALRDASGEIRAALTTFRDGSSGLCLSDVSGMIRAALATHTDGRPVLWLCDASGEIRAVLDTLPDGSAGLRLLDASGEELFSAP